QLLNAVRVRGLCLHRHRRAADPLLLFLPPRDPQSAVRRIRRVLIVAVRMDLRGLRGRFRFFQGGGFAGVANAGFIEPPPRRGAGAGGGGGGGWGRTVSSRAIGDGASGEGSRSCGCAGGAEAAGPADTGGGTNVGVVVEGGA